MNKSKLQEALKTLKQSRETHKRMSNMANEMYHSKKAEIESVFPGLMDDIQDMVKNNDREGILKKMQEIREQENNKREKEMEDRIVKKLDKKTGNKNGSTNSNN